MLGHYALSDYISAAMDSSEIEQLVFASSVGWVDARKPNKNNALPMIFEPIIL